MLIIILKMNVNNDFKIEFNNLYQHYITIY